ncbi:hypothetical protein PPL_04530 [Heterostelium album PN500]|uniref:Uncharacterized protein n=1 Tax=Heterostelium pallidum (strain ATCC 26659 / Pp 5 / PN500) TaxID=670386 RepID=D3B7U2_HETP5|nr:hypothetical protein PPL_04530 [Heterostelium album PN500]EFA82835.1 hypothetical protein PPL_04530 [Heterostelium album PN500]|eukprot:XP_020434952.1 hypothetical protein PPL_04530 [Heterostelium album PN500]
MILDGVKVNNNNNNNSNSSIYTYSSKLNMSEQDDLQFERLCRQKELLVLDSAIQQLTDELDDEIVKNLKKKVRELDNDAWIFEKKQHQTFTHYQNNNNNNTHSNSNNNNNGNRQLYIDQRLNQNNIRRY